MENSSNESTKTAYNRLAENYENRWRQYLSHTHEIFLSKLSPDKHDILLDLSCGTGLLASQLLDKGFTFDRLVLNDLSEEMLSIARQRLEKKSKKIRFSNHSVSSLPFESQSFTKILCLNSFHHYPDQSSAIRECRRLLKPGGQLNLLDWNNSGLFKAVNFAIKQYSPEMINTCSFRQAKDYLKNNSFTIHEEMEWYWRYWKFFSFKAIKKV